MTESQANTWLAEYEERNSDLPKNTRRMLGLFALAANRKVSHDIIYSILGYESTVFYRDISRRWWLILYHSGTGKHWKRFAHLAETQSLITGWKWLTKCVSREKRDLMLQRLGSRPWGNSHKWRQKNRGYIGKRVRWFKMGTWQTRSPWTWLLIEGKSLDSRRVYTRPIHTKLRPHLRLLERECYRRIDPDKMTLPEAMHSTVAYLKKRLRDFTQRNVNTSTELVAWFLTVPVPHGRYRIMPSVPKGATKTQARIGIRRLLRRWR